MSEVLSQDEINALLQGVDAGKVPAGEGGGAPPGAGAGADAPAAGEPGAYHAVDLTKQERSLKGRLPGLEMVLEGLVRHLRQSLTTWLGEPPTVTVATVEQIRFATAQQALEPPVWLQLFKLTPLRGQGVLVIPPALLAAVLQVAFGGEAGQATPLPAREFSRVETLVLQKLGARILGDLRDAWRPVEPIECGPTRTETNPLFASVAGAQDIVMRIELRLDGPGCADVPLAIWIPNAALDPIRQRLQEIGRPADEESARAAGAWRARLEEALGLVEVEVAAELGARRMTMRDVLHMRVGDVIQLGTGREGPVTVTVAGRPRFVGAPGISGGNNAVQVKAAI